MPELCNFSKVGVFLAHPVYIVLGTLSCTTLSRTATLKGSICEKNIEYLTSQINRELNWQVQKPVLLKSVLCYYIALTVIPAKKTKKNHVPLSCQNKKFLLIFLSRLPPYYFKYKKQIQKYRNEKITRIHTKHIKHIKHIFWKNTNADPAQVFDIKCQN